MRASPRSTNNGNDNAGGVFDNFPVTVYDLKNYVEAGVVMRSQFHLHLSVECI